LYDSSPIADLQEGWDVLVKNRKVLRKLMAIEGISQRELATAAGWRSHSYLGRLLRGDVESLESEPAERIARRLGVEVSDLFHR
jgi:transcriptional regulator with XRE-family HTH domain